GGHSVAAHRRAAQWDGWTFGILVDETGQVVYTPEDVAAHASDIATHRRDAGSFEIVVGGYSTPTEGGARMVRSYQDAGATWWLEEINGFRGSLEDMLARIKDGPPR